MGILDLIQDPTVEALIPAVLGAAGGALSGGRVQGGTRGAIGRGLLGGAEGLESGIQTAQRQQQLQMEQKHNAILDQTAAESLKELQADNARRAALRQKYPELSAYPDANLSTGLQDVLARRTFSAMQQHPKYAKALEGLDPNSYDAQTLHSIMDSAYKGQNVTPEQASVIARNNAQAAKAIGETKGTLPAAPEFSSVPLADGNVGAFDHRTGTVRDTGVKGAPKGVGAAPKPTASTTPTATNQKALEEARKIYDSTFKALNDQWAKSGDLMKAMDPDAKPPPPFDEWIKSDAGAPILKNAGYVDPSAAPSTAPAAKSGEKADKSTAPPATESTPKGTATLDPALTKKRGAPVYKAPDGSLWGPA